MRDGLIELGEITRVPEVPVTAARPDIPYRALLGVLSLVLVLLLGGGQHGRRQEPPTVIPARLGDATFIDGDRLFVVSAGRPALRSDMQNRVCASPHARSYRSAWNTDDQGLTLPTAAAQPGRAHAASAAS